MKIDCKCYVNASNAVHVKILSDLLLKDFREDLSTQSAMIKITAEKFTRLFSSIKKAQVNIHVLTQNL